MVFLSRPSSQELLGLIREFMPLNRKHLLGGAGLSVEETERWAELRLQLELTFEGISGSLSLGGKSKRQALRVPVALPTTVTTETEVLSALMTDVSDQGAFFSSETPLNPGTPIRVDIETGFSECVGLQGMIVWVQESPLGKKPGGMGVKFSNLDLEQKQALVAIVENALASY